MKKIVTHNLAMKTLLEMAEAVAPTKANVLILGESGAGKEMIAQLIHSASFRKNRKMVAINCAALPETLIESELFGHEKGSFTGSIATKQGKFEQASGSTILLDEISEMGPHMQAKLLRVIQEAEIDRIGALSPIQVDMRVIATSNKALYEEVKAGRFREDLYYRLNVVVLKVPPLRERLNDIPYLLEHFISEFNKTYSKNIKSVDPKLLEKMQNYSYPGNVREMRNMVERAVLFTKGSHLKLESMSFEEEHTIEGNILKKNEKELIQKVLKSVGGNKTKASEKLGISVRTLRNKLRKYKNEEHLVN